MIVDAPQQVPRGHSRSTRPGRRQRIRRGVSFAARNRAPRTSDVILRQQVAVAPWDQRITHRFRVARRRRGRLSPPIQRQGSCGSGTRSPIG